MLLSKPLSRSRAIALLATLLVAILPVPAAQAQTGVLGLDDAPRTSTLLPTAAGQQVVLEDPEGDESLFGGTPMPADAPTVEQYSSSADIIMLAIAEDQEHLLFSLKHRGYDQTAATTSNVVLGQGYFCSIDFQINGFASRYYSIVMSGEQFLDGGDYRAFANLAVEEEESDDPGDFDRDFIAGLWAENIAYDHYEIVVPKELIEVGAGERALKIGDTIDNIYVECSRSAGLGLSYYDEAGGEAARSTPYPVQASSRSAELDLSFPEELENGVSVKADGPTKLSVLVKNLRDRKLLVNVTAEVVGYDGAPLDGWIVQAAPTFELAKNNSLPASLIVTPPASVQHRDGGLLKVQALPLGYEDHVQVTNRVYAVESPSPERNTLYFHDQAFNAYSCSFICMGDDMPVQLTHGTQFFSMNVLDDDPRLEETDTTKEGLAAFSWDGTYTYLDAPLNRPLRLDETGMFEFALSVKTDVARNIEFEVVLGAGDQVIGYTEQSFDVGQTFSTFTMTFPTNADVLEIPAGEWLWIEVTPREGEVFNFSGSTWVDSVDWRPSETQLTLPLIARPEPIVNITDGRALPTLALSNDTESEEYLNPGQTQAFDMFLVNEGLEADVVGLKAELDAPGWSVAFYPGDQYELEPGKSAPLCVSITAPDDAQDSDVVTVNLTAWSRADPDVRTSTALKLIVIDSIEIEEETCTERGADEFVTPFTENEKSTPGFGLVSILGALALLGVAARRRL